MSLNHIRRPGLLLVDLYNLVFEGGNKPVIELIEKYPASCGEHAHQKICPINRLIAFFRRQELPIWFSTKDYEKSIISGNATHRPRRPPKSHDYEIYHEIDFRQTDIVVKKIRASVFFNTSFRELLKLEEVDCLVVAGESTSGCVRATVVDGFSYEYPIFVIEDCVFDQNPVSHAVNLFDMQLKYASVCSLASFESAIT